jgi:phosphatidylethanolamine/phosphatidyl-N-methylethanolamine N-methyltransferase
MINHLISKKHRGTLSFLREFVCNPLTVGAIAPSSPNLARAMLHNLTLNGEDTVLELGPGTGAFTSFIRAALPNPQHYLGIELEPRFVLLLKKEFPDLHFIQGNAEHAVQLYQQTPLKLPSVIISGLPFASFRRQTQDKIIDNMGELMSSGSVFRTFQYVHAYALPSAVRFRHAMDDLFFSHHRSQVMFNNIPPAYVLTWKAQ